MRFKALLILFFISFLVKAQLVTNGSVSGAPCANSGINGGNAAGWSGCGFSPDLCCLTMPSYVASSSVTPVVSPDGGTWLGLAALGECAQTTITGLTAGQTYTLYFCGACFGTGTSIYNQGPSLPRISVVGSASITVNIPMTASTWYRYQLVFVANAATMTLRCDHLTGSVSYASLDGFSLNPSAPCGPIVLPIELMNFDVTVFGNDKVQLKWITAMEKNNDHFVIERSKDGVNFEAVTRVEGAKNSNVNLSYGAYDTEPLSGISYYRLKQVDTDGSFEYSDLRAVEMKGNGKDEDFTLVPNPASGEVAVNFICKFAANEIINVYDNRGYLVLSKEVVCAEGANNTKLDISSLKNGLYFVFLNTKDKTYKSKLVVN